MSDTALEDIPDDERQERDLKELQRHAVQLTEHWDVVQIITSRFNADGGTSNGAWGAGNWYARYGMLKAWVVREEEQFRIEKRRSDDD